MTKHSRLVVGNWKMNPLSLDEAKQLIRSFRRTAAQLTRTEAVICPPSIFAFAALSKDETQLHNGVQTLSIENATGAKTGEVSAEMLREFGIEYVIVGHSERRAQGETDEIISKQLARALEVGLTPILCVGELVRDEGGAYLETLRKQIQGSLANIPSKYAKNIVLAYEPVWAIGAAEPMASAQIYEMSLFIKKVFADVFGPESAIKITVLYGGSVNFRNAVDIITIGKVDGFLVGRESVNVTGFSELLKTVDAIDL